MVKKKRVNKRSGVVRDRALGLAAFVVLALGMSVSAGGPSRWVVEPAEASGCTGSMSCDSVAEPDWMACKIGELAMRPHGRGGAMTEDSVASLLNELDAWFVDIKMAQIKVESGFGTSGLFKKANNVCGMKVTRSRRTTQLKGRSHNGYGVYNDWESSVIDMILWDMSAFGGERPSREEYVGRLGRVYAENPSYVSMVLSVAKGYGGYVR